MTHSITELAKSDFPTLLQHLPEPPKQLNYRGRLPNEKIKLLTVVGSRQYSTYGQQVVEHLVAGLTGYNVGIISGLALGIDSLAHRAALRAGLYTLAIPGSGIADEVIYPAKHRRLAHDILEADGGLLSEFAPDFKATKWSFAQRNRIMAGIANATLVIEATEQSGTLITARLATDYNRELLVVPGNIFSGGSRGPHQFLKLGATPICSVEDILWSLGIDPLSKQTPCTNNLNLSDKAITLLTHLNEPADIDTLIRLTTLPPQIVTTTLMQLELTGHIKETNGQYYKTN